MLRDRSTRRGFVMLGIAVLVLGAVVTYKLFQDRVDADTLCVVGKEKGQTIVMIDKTDMWNPTQSDRLEAHILGILNSKMKENERLHVFSFGASFEAGFRHRFMACKPPDGTGCKGVFCNPVELKKQYEARFLAPLLSELKTLKVASQGACSPIAEALFDVLSRREIKELAGETRIVLISDMAQNSPVYTAFRGPQSCPGVTGRIDPDRDNGLVVYFDKNRSAMNLSQVSVTAYQVRPAGRGQDVIDRSTRKWEEVFRLLGITQVHWELL